VNNYRQNDYEPYLFHTTDFGKKWDRMVGPGDVQGYVLSFIRDPEEPDLQFLGTEHGLWVSIDGGTQWTRWTVGFPTVPTMDLEIQPRELDLVIGTFGRAAYVLDDLAPLRAYAGNYNKIAASGLTVFTPPVAYLADTRNSPGYYFSGDAYFEGENRPWGARISYDVRWKEGEDGEKKDTVVIRVLDQQGNLVRTLRQVPEQGLNRTLWRLDRKGIRVSFDANAAERQNREQGGGGSVLPGTYHLEFAFRGDTATISIEVQADPRRDYDLAGMKLKQLKTDLLLQRLDSLDQALYSLRKCKESAELVKKLSGGKVSDELKQATEAMQTELDRISGQVFRDESIQGIYEPTDAVYVKMQGTYGITGADQPLTENQLKKYEDFMSVAEQTIDLIHRFLADQWNDYKERVIAEDISLVE
jgi:hypothetical protein